MIKIIVIIVVVVIAVVLLAFAALLLATIHQTDKDMVQRSREGRVARENQDIAITAMFETMIAEIDLKAKGV